MGPPSYGPLSLEVPRRTPSPNAAGRGVKTPGMSTPEVEESQHSLELAIGDVTPVMASPVTSQAGGPMASPLPGHVTSVTSEGDYTSGEKSLDAKQAKKKKNKERDKEKERERAKNPSHQVGILTNILLPLSHSYPR